ncbi:MAG: hypothetical protein II546_03695 [Prevotella sp.]|nr:hypothetical protein [Prevotella sp.]
MKFKFKTSVTLSKVFEVEAQTPKEAMDMIREELLTKTDFNSLDVEYTGFDITDPSLCEYNRQHAEETIAKYKAEMGKV